LLAYGLLLLSKFPCQHQRVVVIIEPSLFQRLLEYRPLKLVFQIPYGARPERLCPVEIIPVHVGLHALDAIWVHGVDIRDYHRFELPKAL